MNAETLVRTYQQPLIALAYHLTGEVAVSQDIVQELLAQWAVEPNPAVSNLRAYLSKAVTNRCLNHLAATRRQRERYKGTWLPEPIISEEVRQVDASLDVSYGFMLLLGKLTPSERAVFLLKEGFDIDYTELAELLAITPANCRQLYHRAKERLAESKKRFPVNWSQQQALLAAFAGASQTGDVSAFVKLLKDDITVFSDGGGKATAALNPLVGLSPVARFLQGLTQKGDPAQTYRLVYVNGDLGVLMFDASERLHTVMVLEFSGEQIDRIYFIRNPDKLPPDLSSVKNLETLGKTGA